VQPHEIVADQPTVEQTILFFALLAGIALAFIAMFRLIVTTITHKTIRKAIETNPQLAEQLLQKLTARRERQSDDWLGMVLVALAVAMVVAPLIAADDPGDVRVAAAAAVFPLLVGGALWLRSWTVERAQRRDRSE
jgi:uncharacterized protein YneF (UPF0154 family)